VFTWLGTLVFAAGREGPSPYAYLSIILLLPSVVLMFLLNLLEPNTTRDLGHLADLLAIPFQFAYYYVLTIFAESLTVKIRRKH